MSSARWQPRPEIEVNRDAALIHEYLLSVAGSGDWGPAGTVIVELLDQHQPHHPPEATQGCDDFRQSNLGGQGDHHRVWAEDLSQRA